MNFGTKRVLLLQYKKNSTGATQRFSSNQRTSSEQKNRSLFNHKRGSNPTGNRRNFDSFVLYSSCNRKKNIEWPRLSLLPCDLLPKFLSMPPCMQMVHYSICSEIYICRCSCSPLLCMNLRPQYMLHH